MAKSSLIGRIAFDLVAHTGKLLAPLKKAKAAIASVAAAPKAIGGAMLRWMAPLAAMIGGLLTLSFVVSRVKKAFEDLGSATDEANRLGVATETLLGLRYAALQSGMSVETLTGALQFLMKQGRSVNELGKIADELQAIADPVRRMQRALKLFGRSGAGMLNVLAGGSAALQEMVNRAYLLGIAINSVDAAKVEAAGDAWADIGMMIDGIARRIAVELSPFIIKAANDFVTWGTTGGGAAAKVRTGMDLLIEGIKWVAGAVQASGVMWKRWKATAAIALAAVVQMTGTIVGSFEFVAEALVTAFKVAWLAVKYSTASTISEISGMIANLIYQLESWLPASMRTGMGSVAAEISANMGEIADALITEFESGSLFTDFDFGTGAIDEFGRNLEDVARVAMEESVEAGLLARDNPWSEQIQKWVDDARRAATPAARAKEKELADAHARESVGALERGSAAAMSAITATQKTMTLEQQQLATQRLMAERLRDIAANTRGGLAPAGIA